MNCLRRLYAPRSSTRAACAALGLIALLAACDDDDGSGYKQSCKRNCERAHDCVSSVDVENCASSCQDDLAAVGDNLRPDYVRGIDMCFDELSCDQLIAATATNACRDESAARLSPSQTAIKLCEAVADSFKECLGLTVGTADCIDSVKVFADPALRSALTCAERACNERISCLEDQLGIDLTAL